MNVTEQSVMLSCYASGEKTQDKRPKISEARHEVPRRKRMASSSFDALNLFLVCLVLASVVAMGTIVAPEGTSLLASAVSVSRQRNENQIPQII